MVKWIFIIVLSMCGTVAADTALAQDFLRSERMERFQRLQQYAQNKFMYQKWLIEAKQYYNRSADNFPIYKLLKPYAGGEYYDPFAKDTIDTLYKYAYLADTAKDPDEASEAAEKFQALLEWHLPNYTILKSAIPLVRTNPALGDVEFLEWMFRHVTEYIFQSGTGQSIYYAYPIYSIDDENLILNAAGVKVIDTEIINNGREYYHIHLTEDRQSGKPGKIYTNMTPVMNHIINVNKAKNPDYSFPLNVPDDFK